MADETIMPREIILKEPAQKGMNCNEVELKRSVNPRNEIREAKIMFEDVIYRHGVTSERSNNQ